MEKISLSAGYRWYYLDRLQLTVHTHVLKAKAFIKQPDGNIYINHLDGIKTNNEVDNLEWTTATGNIVHAYKNGLRTDNTPIRIYDTVNLKTFDCYSLQECARYFSVNGEKIHRYMKSLRNVLFQKRYLLLYMNEDIYTAQKRITSEYMNGAPKFIIGESLDGVQIVFASIATAARYFKTNSGNIVSSIKQAKVKFNFKFRYAEDDDDVANAISDMVKAIPPTRKPKQVEVLDTTTNTVKIWLSLDCFAKSINVKKGTIGKSMYLKNGKWRQYVIKYLYG